MKTGQRLQSTGASKATRGARRAVGTGTYVYCLVRSERKPSIARVPPGVPGSGRARVLDAAGGLWLIVSDVPLERYSAAMIERQLHDARWVTACALSHEAIVERFVRQPALAPMKMFTIFTGDDRAIRHVRARRGPVNRALDRVAGCSEWGVRVEVDRATARRGRRPRPETGTAFLEWKRHLRQRSHGLAAEARRQSDRIHERLSAEARAASRRQPLHVAGQSRRAVLDATYLVSRQAGQFRAAVRQLASDLAKDGYSVTLSGPWPPYHFVTGPR